MTQNIWTLDNGLRILQIKASEDIQLLAREDVAFDALEVGASIESFEAFSAFAPRIKALWHCKTPSVAGLEKLQAIESINATPRGELRFDYRQLKSLKAFECADGSVIPAKYLNHPSLESLNLGECKVETFKVLSEATKLRQVRLSACKVKSLEGIEGMRLLRELRLPEAKTLTDIGALAKCADLEALEISNAKKLPDISSIKSLHKLRVLFVSAPEAALDGVDWISGMPNLRCVGLYVPTKRIDWGVFARHPRIYDFSIHAAPGGLTETDAEITAQMESSGRKVLKLTRFKAGPAIRVELEPVKGTIDPLPSTHYQNVLGKVPPN